MFILGVMSKSLKRNWKVPSLYRTFRKSSHLAAKGGWLKAADCLDRASLKKRLPEVLRLG